MIHCPYCNERQEINHDDGRGYEENVQHHQQCGHCGKYFVFETSIIFQYDVSKADCLNEGEHLWMPTITAPKRYTKMTCFTCGETREPTEQEKRIHEIPND